MFSLNLLNLTRKVRASLIVKSHIKYAKRNSAKELKFTLLLTERLCRFEIDGAYFGQFKSNLNPQIISVIESEIAKDYKRRCVANDDNSSGDIPLLNMITFCVEK
jgi:hypothetical protein